MDGVEPIPFEQCYECILELRGTKGTNEKDKVNVLSVCEWFIFLF